LRISYSDGAILEIQKEQGRFDVVQAAFSKIQIASDRWHIGWVAEYAICAQSYPCPAELVIFQDRKKPLYISPDFGVVWKWCFFANGSQVVVQYGFPHGVETGEYALYESDSGRRLALFSPRKGADPEWVQYLQAHGQ